MSIAPLAGVAAQLERLLKLRAIPFGMKLFERVEEMEAIPKIRRPKAVHALDQVVAQAARLGWTVGITADDLVGAQCRAVVGLGPQDEAWLSGRHMAGVWYATEADAAASQRVPSLHPTSTAPTAEAESCSCPSAVSVPYEMDLYDVNNGSVGC